MPTRPVRTAALSRLVSCCVMARCSRSARAVIDPSGPGASVDSASVRQLVRNHLWNGADVSMVQAAHATIPRRHTIPSGELLYYDPVPTERARWHRPAERGRVRRQRLHDPRHGCRPEPPLARLSRPRSRAQAGRGRAPIDQADGARGTRTMGVDAAARLAWLLSSAPPAPVDARPSPARWTGEGGGVGSRRARLPSFDGPSRRYCRPSTGRCDTAAVRRRAVRRSGVSSPRLRGE